MRVVGYIRVSTREQAESGAGLVVQREAVTVECGRRGWELVEIFEDLGASGRSTNGRPGLSAALLAVRSGVDGIVVSKLDRLSRSLADFARLMAEAQKAGWNLVALDLGVDLSTPAGKFLANVLASAAEWEREIIGQRTKDAMAVKKAQGVKMGRPSAVPQKIREFIHFERTRGISLAQIAFSLNGDRVPTGHGGAKWYPSSVRAAVLAGANTLTRFDNQG